MKWILKFRTNKGVQTGAIETKTDHHDEAQFIGRKYVEALPTPTARYVSVEPADLCSYRHIPNLTPDQQKQFALDHAALLGRLEQWERDGVERERKQAIAEGHVEPEALPTATAKVKAQPPSRVGA
jgi:hypothetical protein